MTERITYKDAGVDVELADRMIGSLTDRIKRTFRPEVLGKFGGFAALVRPDWHRYESPLLVSTTDGVGTKLKIAFLTGIHDAVGIDLVAMSVNDLIVCGAEPLFFLDYFATGGIDPQTYQSVISGIAHGCEEANCSLVGGETAEMPDFYKPGEYDLAGFCVGIVDEPRVLDGSKVQPGDVVLGLASTGLHSNGFSLVRKVLLERKAYPLDAVWPEFGRTLGEELLQPTAIYVKPIMGLLERVPVSAMAHITGGGFIGNIPRVVPESCSVVIRRDAWEIPPIFDVLKREAGLDDDEMFRTFNMGVGLVIIVPASQSQNAVDYLRTVDVRTWHIGDVIPREVGAQEISIV